MEAHYSQSIQQNEEELQSRQRSASKVVVYQRLQMLRLLKSCQSKNLSEAARAVGVNKRSTQRWWRQYQEQSLESLLVVAPTRQPV